MEVIGRERWMERKILYYIKGLSTPEGMQLRIAICLLRQQNAGVTKIEPNALVVKAAVQSVLRWVLVSCIA